MRKVQGIYLACCLVTCANIFAQKDTMRLDEITITDYRSSASSKNFSETKIDSASRNQFLTSSVAQLFLQQNNAFVKTYGPANIASLTLRGSTTQQVAVVWNGININNPMLGQTDVSLLPVGFFDDVSLQKGPLSSYWGSGAMAGILNLRSAAASEGINIKAGSSYSSFQNFSQFVSVGFSKGRWSSSTRVFTDLSQNKYTYYTNADSSLTATQQHARATQRGLMQDLGFKVSNEQRIGLHLWVQDADRQVPYTLQEIKQQAWQKDKALRVLLDWKLTREKYSFSMRYGYFRDSLHYNLIQQQGKTVADTLDSQSGFNTAFWEMEGQFHLRNNISVFAGVNGYNTSADLKSRENDEVLNYGQLQFRNACFANVSWKYRNLSSSVYGRVEVFDLVMNNPIPTGGVSAHASLLKWLSVRANTGSVYRYPTLNDLYWPQWGNPDLKPEKGFSEEGSLILNFPITKFSFSFTGTMFNRNINNWMMWLPGKYGNWTPQNVPAVWSRGGETNSELTYTGSKFRTSLTVITNYVVSTRTQTLSENDNSKGRQLPYVPMYSGSGIFSVVVGQLSLRAAYTYTGYRYLTSDNYGYLAPYQLFDLRVTYCLPLKKMLFNFFVEGNNLLNQNYYSVAQYPMPLRNFRMGINFQFSKSNKKQI